MGLETPDYGRICNDVIENSRSGELKEFIDGLDGDASVGDVFVTKGYALPAKNIVHLICPHFASDPDLTVFQSVVRKVLFTCKEKGFRNIGIPVFGTGANGYNRPDVYNLLTFMCSSFVEYYPEFNITLVTVSKSVQAKHKKMAKYATDAFKHKTDMEITHYCMMVGTFKKNTNAYKTIDVYEDPKGFFGGEFEKTAQVALLPQDDPNRPTITLDDKTMLKIGNVKEYMEAYADRRFPNQFSNADKILIRAKRYLGLSSKDDIYDLLKAVPKLGGILTITSSEGLTHCKHKMYSNCPKCKDIPPYVMAAEINNTIYKAVRDSGASTRVVASLWGWMPYCDISTEDALKGIAFVIDSEGDTIFIIVDEIVIPFFDSAL